MRLRCANSATLCTQHGIVLARLPRGSLGPTFGPLARACSRVVLSSRLLGWPCIASTMRFQLIFITLLVCAVFSLTVALQHPRTTSILFDTSNATLGADFGLNAHRLSGQSGVSAWRPLPVKVTDSVTSERFTDIEALAIGRYVMHPALVDGERIDVAKLWRSSVDGTVVIAGEATKMVEGGDGVLFEITVDDVVVLSKLLREKGQFEFVFKSAVNLNSTIAFVASIGYETAFCDALWTHFTISVAASEPETPPCNGGRPPLLPVGLSVQPRFTTACDVLFPSSTCAPRVFIVGTMKCGTNTLGSLLSEHPSTVPPLFSGEPDFFYPAHLRSSTWWYFANTTAGEHDTPMEKYRAMFPETDWVSNFTYDKSPSYLHSFSAAARLLRTVPRAKILITTCEPVQRFWKHYWHVHDSPEAVTLHGDPSFGLPFDEHVRRSFERKDQSLLVTGDVVFTSAKWKFLFGHENVHIWNLEEYDADPQESSNRLFMFLGLPPIRHTVPKVAYEHTIAHPFEEMNSSSRVALFQYYASRAKDKNR